MTMHLPTNTPPDGGQQLAGHPSDCSAAAQDDRRDAGRAATVKLYRSLDAPTDGTFDRIARIAATVCATPIATVTIVDEDAVWLAAAEGLEGITQVGTDPGLCTSAILQDGPYVVNDADADPRTLAHPLVRGEFGLRFYAAAPIVTSDGHALGTVNVIDRQPREATAAQLGVLTDLAGEVADVLELKLFALQAVRRERVTRKQEATRRRAAELIADRLQEAAGEVRGHRRPDSCQLGGQTPCQNPPEIKIADSWGDSAWGCFAHGEDALINVPSVFLAAEDGAGIAAYRQRGTPPDIRGEAATSP